MVLVDWSVDDEAVRQQDMATAMDLAASLPETHRRIVAVGTRMETLLAPREPIHLASLRGETYPGPAPRGLTWAIESLAAGADRAVPLAIHVVGDGPVDAKRLASLQKSANSADGASARLSVDRVQREPVTARCGLMTLGVSDSADGAWGAVDVWMAFAGDDKKPVTADRINITIDNTPLNQPLIARGENAFELRGVPANGATLHVSADARPVGAVTLPQRSPIRVRLDDNVPESLRQLITLDSACEIVTGEADVRIGSADTANLRLTGADQPAFVIQTDGEDPQAALGKLVDELALKQIDAMGIAEKTGRVIDVQVFRGEKRSVAIWNSLFTPAFDFQESRACPLVVSRALRWLANQPPLVEYAAMGERLPTASPKFSRADGQQAVTADGRVLSTTRLLSEVETADVPESKAGKHFAAFSPYTWIGLLVAVLLVGEWILYQRGQVP